jgi:hypothetical protein
MHETRQRRFSDDHPLCPQYPTAAPTEEPTATPTATPTEEPTAVSRITRGE